MPPFSPATLRCLVLCAVAGLLLGCPPPAATCRSDGDCPSTQLCRAGQCHSACNSALDCTRREACVDGACMPLAATDAAAGQDASVRDGAIAESGPGDVLRTDVGAGDLALPADAPLPDLVSVDTARADAAGADAAQPDASPGDAATEDVAYADGAPEDLASPDLRVPDVETADAAAADLAGGLDGVASDQPIVDDTATAPDLGTGLDLALLDQGAGDIGSDATASLDAAEYPCTGLPPLELCPSTDGTLRACYTFDDDIYVPDTGNSGVPDHSASGNHGMGYGLNHATGVHGLAAAFAGAQMVTVADDPSLDFVDQVTVEAWVYPEAWPAAGARMGILDNNAQYAIFLRPGGVLTCGTNSQTSQLEGGQAPLGQWTHVACVLSGGVLRQYLDGVQVAEGSGLPAMNPGDTNPMNLGANSPSGDHFVGRLDSVRVWSVARSAADLCWAAER